MLRKLCLKNIIDLKEKIVVGLNSGTSADGIDAAVVKIIGNGLGSKVEFIMGKTFKFDKRLKTKIKRCAEPAFTDGESWLKLDIILAKLFSQATLSIIRSAGLRVKDIALIGSHGQTIRHKPASRFGTFTCQLADPARIAVGCGIVTVGDFRVADIAAGGQGAPLTPIVNAIVFREKSLRVGVLNIGGIANITIITPYRNGYKVFGCDTGPGNMLVDYLAEKLFRVGYDKGGRLASYGIADDFIIRKVLSGKFFGFKGPKSAGREKFGRKFGEKFLALCRKKGLSKNDIMNTASMLTIEAFKRCCVVNKFRFDRLILAGGGAKNLFFVKAIEDIFPNVEILNSFDCGFPSDYLEAVSFGVLANEAICSNRYNLKTVTEANKAVVLGKICQP